MYGDSFAFKNGRARNYAALKLYLQGKPESKAVLANYYKIMNDFAESFKRAFAKEGTQLKIEDVFGVVKTSFVCFCGKKVVVDQVYSNEQGDQRWGLMLEWIEAMDELLKTYG